MENTMADSGQTSSVLHLSAEESRTAISALAYSVQTSSNLLEFNWDIQAYNSLTDLVETAVGKVDVIVSRLARSRALLAKLTTHLNDPHQGLELSVDEFEEVGDALYTFGVIGFHHALLAISTNKLSFRDAQQESRAFATLNRQNQQAFALFNRLEQLPERPQMSWMRWQQADMESWFAPSAT